MNGYPRSFFTNVTYRFLLAPDFLSSPPFFPTQLLPIRYDTVQYIFSHELKQKPKEV